MFNFLSFFRFVLKPFVLLTQFRRTQFLRSSALPYYSRDRFFTDSVTARQWDLPFSSVNHRPKGMALWVKFCVLVMLLLTVVWSTTSSADERDAIAKQTEQWLMAKYDTNGDSIISVDEISQKREKMFSHMDDNGDGQVSMQEYALLDAKKRALIVRARFSKLDANADGKLTGEEYIQYYGAFGAFDLDGNGKITSDEMTSDTAVDASTQVAATAEPKCFLWLCVRAGIH